MQPSPNTEPTRIDWLFAKMLVAYGAAWDSLWAGIDIRAVKNDWEQELAHVTDDGVLYAIEHRPRDRPPNVKQFLALCCEAPPRPLPRLTTPKPTAEQKAKVSAMMAGLKHKLAMQKVGRP